MHPSAAVAVDRSRLAENTLVPQLWLGSPRLLGDTARVQADVAAELTRPGKAVTLPSRRWRIPEPAGLLGKPLSFR